METKLTPPEEGSRKDVYNFVTDNIIEQLKKGTVPWRKPWTTSGIPRNLLSGRPYRGINVMLLASLGYEQNYFLTYKQLQSIGGSVIRGERASMVVYWNFVEKDNETETGRKKIPYLRYYNVLNVAQCTGIEAHLPPFSTIEEKPIEACERVLDQMPRKPTIQHKEQSAWYNPISDIVNMPKQRTFESMESYYATLFHELVHSTGHVSRLDRKDLLQMAEFGSERYSHEELVAEIGTCYLQSISGITGQFEQSAAYIKGWLSKLENDRRFIFSAANHAQKATDYILNIESTAEGGKPEEAVTNMKEA